MLRKCYQAEVLKNRHTMAAKLAVLMPVTVVLLASVLTKNYVVIDCYNWWYVGILPACVALVTGIVDAKEKRQKNRNILSLPIDMKTIWDGKVVYGIRMLAVSLAVLGTITLFVWFLFRTLLHMEFPVEISASRQGAGAAVLLVTSLWQVPFCLFLQQIAGNGAAPLIHVAVYGCMACTVSLKPYFMLVPGGISARLMCCILGVLPNGLVARPGSDTYLPELVSIRAVPVGILSSLIWFFLLWQAGRWWFGKRVME